MQKDPSQETAEDLNKKGNRAYEKREYQNALRYYTSAICLEPSKHTFYSNRVAAYCALNMYEDALKDADKAISLAPAWSKAYARKGTVLWYMGQHARAKDAFVQASLLDPSNEDLKRQIEELERSLPKDDQSSSSSSTASASTSSTISTTTSASNTNTTTTAAAAEKTKAAVTTLAEDFECVLCLKLLHEPVTTPCGHTFCKSCLFRAMDHGANCPLCRAVIHIVPNHPVSVTLQSVIKKLFPEEYAQRAEEVRLENQQDETCLPLFPLNSVIFPNTRFPMHIFEPRYRLMIRRCMAGAKMFGLINIKRDPSGTSWVPYDVGCTLEISKLTLLPDGRSYIETKGTKRFRIMEKWEQDGYMVGKVQWIDDEEIPEDLGEELEEFRRNVEEARSLLSSILAIGFQNETVQRMLAQAGDIPSGDKDFSFWLSSLLPVNNDTKQELLEMQSTPARYARVVTLIRRVLEALERETSVAGGNQARPGTDEEVESTGFNCVIS